MWLVNFYSCITGWLLSVMSIPAYTTYNKYFFYRIALFIYLLVFIAGFYFIQLPSSRHSALVRGGILVMLCIFILEFLLRKPQGKKSLLRLSKQLTRLVFPGKLLLGSFLALFLYFIIRSGISGDWDAVRRVITVMLFLLCVAFSISTLNFDMRWLITAVATLSVFFSANYVREFFEKQQDFLLNPVRTPFSGLDWYASYENTIIAALYWSVLLLALIWMYMYSSKKIITVLCFMASAILLLAIYHTAARTAWVASIFGLCGLFVLAGYHQRRKMLAIFIPATLIAVTYTILQPQAILRNGLTYRDYIWKEHLALLEGQIDWFFGRGIGALESFVKLPSGQLAIHPHSIYVETLYTGGGVAIALFLVLQIAIAYCLYSRQVCFTGKSFVGGLLVGGGLAMIFDFNGLFGSPNLVWLWLWLPLAVLLAGVFRSCRYDPESVDSTRQQGRV